MDITHPITFMLIGAAAGWLGGLIMSGRGFGIIGDIALGAAGALMVRVALKTLGLTADNTLLQLLSATVGAIILIGLLRTFRSG